MGITGQHPVCPRCCTILASVTLNYLVEQSQSKVPPAVKDRRRDLRLALLYKIVTGHVAINPNKRQKLKVYNDV